MDHGLLPQAQPVVEKPAIAPALRWKRAAVPLHFPSEALVPESKRHLDLRTAIYHILKASFAATACIGSDQFVYWNAADPSRCLAPDAFLRLGTADQIFDSWKTWERGAPELAVEILSNYDEREPVWETKLERYQELGVRELVRFDADASIGSAIRVWDRIDGDLVERDVEADRTPCTVLHLHWCVAKAGEHAAALRLSDTEGRLLLLPEERERANADRERINAELERANAERERARADATECRLAELAAELARHTK